MNIALWIAQGLLAAMYLMVGSMKAFQPAKVRENPRMTWAHGRIITSASLGQLKSLARWDFFCRW